MSQEQSIANMPTDNSDKEVIDDPTDEIDNRLSTTNLHQSEFDVGQIFHDFLELRINKKNLIKIKNNAEHYLKISGIYRPIIKFIIDDDITEFAHSDLPCKLLINLSINASVLTPECLREHRIKEIQKLDDYFTVICNFDPDNEIPQNFILHLKNIKNRNDCELFWKLIIRKEPFFTSIAKRIHDEFKFTLTEIPSEKSTEMKNESIFSNLDEIDEENFFEIVKRKFDQSGRQVWDDSQNIHIHNKKNEFIIERALDYKFNNINYHIKFWDEFHQHLSEFPFINDYSLRLAILCIESKEFIDHALKRYPDVNYFDMMKQSNSICICLCSCAFIEKIKEQKSATEEELIDFAVNNCPQLLYYIKPDITIEEVFKALKM